MKRLSQILKSGQIPHALLFCGPKGSGKKEAAYKFASDLLQKPLENHPDVHLLFPEGKAETHPIESIRQIAQNAALAPFMASWKIFIVHDAEKMLPTSSNALLKTLEEPPSQTLILLLCDHPEKLLPTIASRCQKIEFVSSIKNRDPETLALLAANFPREKLKDFDTKEGSAVFETILLWFRDRMLIELGASQDLLHFPDHAEQVRKTPCLPLEKVEGHLNHCRLAYERSTKLSTCLEAFRLQIQQD